MENKYKKENTLVERVIKSHKKLKSYYPERVPIIIQRYKNDNNLFELPKKQFLVPYDMDLSRLIIILRNQFKNIINPTMALYFITDKGTILCGSDIISKIYETHKDEDQMLYLFYCTENTFG